MKRCAPSSFSKSFAAQIGMLIFSLFVIYSWEGNECRADSLASVDVAGLQVVLSSSEQGAYNLSLSVSNDSKTEIPSPKILVLQGPTRLVVDMPGITARRTQTIRLKDPGLSALRYSAFGDGTRFVCDFRAKTDPRFVWQKNPVDGSVIIRFSVETSGQRGEKLRVPHQVETPMATATFTPRVVVFSTLPPTPRPISTLRPTATLRPTSTPRPTAIPTEKPEPTLTPTPRPTPIPTPKPTPRPTATMRPKPTPRETPTRLPPKPTATAEKPVPMETPENEPIDNQPIGNQPMEKPPVEEHGTATLSAVSFRKTGKTNNQAVVFKIKNLQEYNLNDVGDGAYELVLKGVQSEDRSLLLPMMPPENFERFEMVVPRIAGSNLRVKIRVEKGVTLLPFVVGDELWIKASEAK